MRVVESVGFYFPDSVGGTEVYVSSLAKKLRTQGIDCVVTAPSQSEQTSHYIYDGVEVFRYSIPRQWSRREVQGLEPPRHLVQFENWLSAQRADVYHQHSWTTACGSWHLGVAKRLGLKTAITVHVPGKICLRGTMMHEGRVPCDGRILLERCGPCWLRSKGMPAIVAKCLPKLRGFGILEPLPRIGSILGTPALVANHSRQFQDAIAAADRVVAVCDWLKEAFLANGVASEKLLVNRQGVRDEKKFGTGRKANKSSDSIRFGFLGRWDPVKGIHVLVEAFKLLPHSLPIQLDICAVGTGPAADKYRDQVQSRASGDSRIQFRPAITHSEVGAFLSSIDALAVPSQWLETGPLVVLEAFMVGTPVIGSALGGIKELITHERDGLLVSHDNVNAWTEALLRLANHTFLNRLRQGIGPVRTMTDVAVDMAAMYRELNLTEAHAARFQ